MVDGETKPPFLVTRVGFDQMFKHVDRFRVVGGALEAGAKREQGGPVFGVELECLLEELS